MITSDSEAITVKVSRVDMCGLILSEIIITNLWLLNYENFDTCQILL